MASDQKPRIFQNGRDMGLSMLVIVALMVAIVLPTGMCTFNPGAPESGPVSEVDPAAFLDMEARTVDFDVVVPATPEGWTPNSARRTALGDQPAPTIGYVTAGEGFLQLIQTGAPADEAVREIDADPREQVRTENVDGTEVAVYASEESDVRDLWVTEAHGTTMLINGSASDDEFRELAASALEARPVETP